MKVICIDDVFLISCDCAMCKMMTPPIKLPELGEVYTVSETIDPFGDGYLYYNLEEFTEGKSYAADHFAQVDGPDEIDIAKEREQQRLQPLNSCSR